MDLEIPMIGESGSSIGDNVNNVRPGILIDKESDLKEMGPGFLQGDDMPLGRLRRQNGIPVLVDEVMGN